MYREKEVHRFTCSLVRGFGYRWVFVFCVCLLTITQASAQTVEQKLATAYAAFEKDAQLSSAISSLYVVDASTGKVVFERAGRVGLAPASTQKIITAAAAYEVLGKEFRYQTRFLLKPAANKFELSVQPSGDPTLGSWRWKQTSSDSVLTRLKRKLGFTAAQKPIAVAVINPKAWSGEATPGGWIWDDIGNYYGAGAEALNWNENQYNLALRSAEDVGGKVEVVATKPVLYNYSIRSEATSGAKGSGDNAYIYFGKEANLVVRGTIPAGEKSFTIAGAMPAVQQQFVSTLSTELQKAKSEKASPVTDSLVHTETSPPLDSIAYWFLRRSVNLYGEALLKTMSVKTTNTTENAERMLRRFWVEKNIGIDAAELNLHDGSGLSPLNRVTTHAQVAVLQWAQKQPWFGGYFAGFPEYNGMKLKSGTISGAKGFCGYHTSASGQRFIVSFLVNNYNGAAAQVVQKMYKVLDCLK